MDYVQERGDNGKGCLMLFIDPDIYIPLYVKEITDFCAAEKERNDPRRKQLQLLFENEKDPAEKRLHKQQLDVFLREQFTFPSKMDQFCIECAYQFMKLDIAAKYEGTPIKNNVRGDGGRKDRWALTKHPEGRGAHAATQGRQARRLYRAMRGASDARRAGIHV